MRSRFLTATTAALVLLAVSVSGSEAGQANTQTETCAGETPTVVADSNNRARFYGTEGDDVILVVTDDIGNEDPYQLTVVVIAYDGDDLICVQNNDDSGTELISINIYAGGGSDSVIIPRAGDETPRTEYNIQYAEDLDLDLRTGPSSLSLALPGVGVGYGTIRGGTGADRTELSVDAVATLKVNLKDHFVQSRAGGQYRYTVHNISHVIATATKLVMTGDRRANWLVANRETCQAVLKGGDGDDRLFATDVHDYGLRPHRDCKRTRVLDGQDGDDRLGGSVYPDRIIGGPGRDITNAGSGFDRCRTVEVIRANSCERSYRRRAAGQAA